VNPNDSTREGLGRGVNHPPSPIRNHLPWVRGGGAPGGAAGDKIIKTSQGNGYGYERTKLIGSVGFLRKEDKMGLVWGGVWGVRGYQKRYKKGS